jgi:hypothetical protein
MVTNDTIAIRRSEKSSGRGEAFIVALKMRTDFNLAEANERSIGAQQPPWPATKYPSAALACDPSTHVSGRPRDGCHIRTCSFWTIMVCGDLVIGEGQA